MLYAFPLVSIIVPVYGTEQYLPSCIDSLCSQTYSNIEIILVDDQSPDRCSEICDSYSKKDDRILVIHQKNKGVSGARNTGLDHAVGEYIMFVDSDDKLLSDAVKVLIEDALIYDADIVSATSILFNDGHSLCVSDDGKVTIHNDEEPLLLSLNGERSTESVWAKLFKSSFINNIRFKEGKNINEDGFFIFQCCLNKPVYVQHNVPIYIYNVRVNSASRQVFSEEFLSMLYFCNEKEELIKDKYPHLINELKNMQVRTHLQFLDILCSVNGKKYLEIQNNSISVITQLQYYHKPINKHHELLSWIVVHKLYPIYKIVIRIKYYR